MRIGKINLLISEVIMRRRTKKRSVKSGLPPGSLVHIGEERAEEVSITVMDYDEGSFIEKVLKTSDECLVFRNKPTVTWINVDGLNQVDVIRKMGECYGFHPLVLEDILNTNQRPKLEDYGDYDYIVVKMLHSEKITEVVPEQISFILGSNFVFSFQEGIKGDVFDPIRQRIRTGKGRIRSMGADYLMYSLIDAIVDNYFVVLEEVGEQIERLEEEVEINPQRRTLNSIHQLKREMIFLRKAVWPLREVAAALERGESPLIKDTTRVYMRDIYDHIIQVMDIIETYRDMLSGMFDIYLSSISNRLNEVMKFLTVIGTIFLPLTFIVGLYGMNFQNMPELKWEWGYYAVLVLMGVITFAMMIFFRKKKWL